jgi:signal transduction histidine kinase
MQKETLRIRNIVRGLNDFARHQPDPDEILKNTTDVHRILEETLEAFQIQLTEKQMEVVREFRAAPAEVFGKKDHLRMAFTNLISNAVEASREKSLIRLRTSSSILDRASAMALRSYEAHGGTSGTAPGAQRVLGLQEEFSLPQILKEGDRIVRIDVCDHGSGISPELLGKIFEPFVTTKDVGYGLGLGLAITYSIIRSHGGFIEVESEVGRGSRFSVVLAAARPLPLPGRVNDHPPASTPSLT